MWGNVPTQRIAHTHTHSHTHRKYTPNDMSSVSGERAFYQSCQDIAKNAIEYECCFPLPFHSTRTRTKLFSFWLYYFQCFAECMSACVAFVSKYFIHFHVNVWVVLFFPVSARCHTKHCFTFFHRRVNIPNEWQAKRHSGHKNVHFFCHSPHAN